jgi:FkbM family methyltransferase
MNFYSQCAEDKFLFEKYFSKYNLSGPKFYFEMGAMDGITYSNTKFYEDTLNWSGLLVEANPLTFSKLILNRPKNKLMNIVCSSEKKALEFNICKNVPAVCGVESTKPSDFDRVYYRHSEMIKLNLVPVSLDSIFENSGVYRFDLCVLDVEGHEVNVLRSFSFKIPTVLWLIEALEDEEKNKEVLMIMETNNFRFMEKCAHNYVFIHNEFLKYFSNIEK